jgi:hypothetical protein
MHCALSTIVNLKDYKIIRSYLRYPYLLFIKVDILNHQVQNFIPQAMQPDRNVKNILMTENAQLIIFNRLN